MNMHGMSCFPEYRIWIGIKVRCLNKDRHEYPAYGGRGIGICERWKNSFECFYDDMGPRPSKKHSIDRIDNNGDYCPENCRWVTQTKQNINQRKRRDNKSGVRGVNYCNRDNLWMASICVRGKRDWVYFGRDFFDACCARKSAESKYWSEI